jgi:hypothetical protein
MLVNSDQARLALEASPDDSAALSHTMDVASPLGQQSGAFRRAIARLRSRLRAEECRMLPSFGTDDVFALAQRLATGASITASSANDASRAFGQDWTFTSGTSLDYSLVQQYAGLAIAHAVLAHEMGHSLGLMHNFAASADAMNYDDTYWQLRGQGHPKGIQPRYEYLADPTDLAYYSKQELAGGIEEHSQSSVMDDLDVNHVAHGLGRYDTAALKDVYVGLVEAFKSVADGNMARIYAANTAGPGHATPVDRTSATQPHAMHYAQIPTIFGADASGHPTITADNRYDVFLSETTTTSVPGWGPPSFSNVTSDGHLLVPYRYGDDASAGLDWKDQRGDLGADAYESVHYLASRMLDGYFATSFARASGQLSSAKYVDRLWSRSIDPIRQGALAGVFDLVAYQDAAGSGTPLNSFLDEPFAVVGQAALETAADALVALLTMPETGPANPVAQFDGTNLLEPSASGSPVVTVPIGNGRSLASLWGSSSQISWFDQLERAGSYYDKTLALQALLDRELPLASSAGTQAPPALVQLGFSTVWPGEVLRFMGGWLAEDMTDVAPIVRLSSNKAVSPVDLATVSASSNPGRSLATSDQYIDPQNAASVETWAAILFGAGVDPVYRDYVRLWIDGSPGGVNASPSSLVSFVDPFSAVTYKALRFPSTSASGPGVGASRYVHPSGGASTETGVAARMLLHLADLESTRQTAITNNNTALITRLQSQEQSYLQVVKALADLNDQLAGTSVVASSGH